MASKTLVEALRPVLSMAVEHTPDNLVEEYLESIVRDNPETFLRPIEYRDLVDAVEDRQFPERVFPRPFVKRSRGK